MKTLVCLALLGVAIACTAPSTAPEAQPRPIVVGGYNAADDTSQLRAARNLAIDELYRRFPTRALIEGVTSEVQVVAGLNYRFRIEMSGDKAVRPIYSVVVFQSLQDELSVTSVKRIVD
ncbi:MAG: hypothetical protein SGJ21_12710 [Alphaproteobacteria bacterium]|nr:hypothetical protein [Alphaproteobacteria bacterium]